MINSLPHLITPTLTGRSTVEMLFAGLVLPGTKARSGMNAPKGTFIKRLLSINHTEQTGCWACAAAPNKSDAHERTTIDASKRACNASLFIALLPLA